MSNTKNLVIFSEDEIDTQLEVFRNSNDKCVIIVGENTNDFGNSHLVVLSKDDISELIKELQKILKEVVE